MADDRTLAPSSARWSRAWRAGMRPWSAWLWPAVACGLLALALDQWVDSGELWLDPTPGAVTPAAWLESIATALGTILALAGLAAFALSLLTARLGWISTSELHRLQPAPTSPAVLVRLLLCAALALGVVLALAGVLAGSARAVDASETGLAALWLGWASRAFTALAAGLGLAAVIELLLDRRERDRQLWQTPQQAVDEARAAGGRWR